MFSFFKKKAPPPRAAPAVAPAPAIERRPAVAAPQPEPAREPAVEHPPRRRACVPKPPQRKGWLDKLRQGLRKTGSSIAQVFTGTQIDDALYEELESALLMADAGVKATGFLLADLKRRVKDGQGHRSARRSRALLVDAIAELLAPLERALGVGRETPTVIMVVGVNGAGKTTSIGKLTRHLADGGSQRAAGRGRHLPRRGARAARGVGRPQPRGNRQPGGRRPGGGELRRGARRARRAAATSSSPTPPAGCRRSCT